MPDTQAFNATLPSSNTSVTPAQTANDQDAEVARLLQSYWIEADTNRKAGLNPRDAKWMENTNLYWNRYDFTRKAGWQAQEVLPEVSTFVDRFAAAMKEALVAAPTFYSVHDPADEERDLSQSVQSMTDAWLSMSGRNQVGTCLDFSAVFEEQLKLGALKATSSIVQWKDDKDYGRVAIESVDPSNVWLDHTNRNLYRIRRTELDRHDLLRMATQKDGSGEPLFKLEAVQQLVAGIDGEMRMRAEQMTGGGQIVHSQRVPIYVDEYLATIVDRTGKTLYDGEKMLTMVANGRYVIRGPEPNPFWHGNDWLVFAPLVTTPLSPYGRSYMEDFGSVAKTFIELTNMILDAVHVSSIKAFAVVPGLLTNPGQLNSGISPNKIFMLEEGVKPEDFAKALDLGTLPPEAIQVWTAMKNELREAGGMNEIGLGQLAPKGRTSATEIASTQQSSSAIVRAVAQTVESRYLNPTLDLVWRTGLQHMRKNDKGLMQVAGQDVYSALYANRKDLAERPLTFKAQGISALIQKGQQLQALLQIMQIVGSNPLLTQQFVQMVDMQRLIELLFELSNIDMRRLQATDREKLIQQITQPLQALGGQAGGQPGTASQPGQQAVGSAVNALGIGRGSGGQIPNGQPGAGAR